MKSSHISYDEVLRQNILSEEQKIRILNQWNLTLGLQHIPKRAIFIIDNNRGIPFYKQVGVLGLVHYSEEEQQYIIRLQKEANEYVIIHELGHIYHFKHTNHLYHKDPPIYKEFNPIFRDFYAGILDSFTNYQLFQFLQFQDIYIENINDNWFISPKNDFGNILGFYVKTYLCYNFILRKEDKAKLLNCNFNLQRTKRILCIKGENIYKKSIKANIDQLDQHLNLFDKIKNTTDYNQIIEFIISGLKTLNLWSKEVMDNNIKYLRQK